MDLFDIVAARQGGTGGGTPQIQSNWEQNDSSKKDYIKNRTHWKEEVNANYLTLPYLEPIPELELAPYGRKIGLELGQTYTIECEYKGQILTYTATATELPKDIFGIEVPGVIFLRNENIRLTLLDGVDGDVTKGEIYLADNCYYNFTDLLTKIKIYGVESTEKEVVVHKLSNEYLTIDNRFNPESENAQSGIAVEQAIDKYDISLRIGTDKLAEDAVTTEKIQDGAITFQKLEQFENLMLEDFSTNTYYQREFGKILRSLRLWFYITVTEDDFPENCNTVILYTSLGSVSLSLNGDFSIGVRHYFSIVFDSIPYKNSNIYGVDCFSSIRILKLDSHDTDVLFDTINVSLTGVHDIYISLTDADTRKAIPCRGSIIGIGIKE